MRISKDALTRFAETALAAAGSDETEAAIVAAHLVGANLRGHDSHGVGMIPEYWQSMAAGVLTANRHATLLQDSGAIAVFDGGWGYGQVIAREATDWAVDKAGETGVAMFALRNTHHVGRVGTYGEQAAAAGLVSIHFVNVLTKGARVAPYAAREGRFGTDPICIAWPATAKTPSFVLDFATSGTAAGKLRVAANRGVQAPEGAIIDADGNPTTDPGIFFHGRGAMLSFGGYKATGLAVACELLAGALTGSGVVHAATQGRPGVRNGMLSIVFDPARFGDPAAFAAEIETVRAWVKSAAQRTPEEPVLIAGEPELAAMADRLKNGIEIDETSWAGLRAAALEVGLSDAWLDSLA